MNVFNLYTTNLCDFLQGLYQKAEALYYQGDFEKALVLYHRGNKQRPEVQEFRLGIQKSQEAINNSIGCKYYCHDHCWYMYVPVTTRKSADKPQ
jgi:hypothetical protein